MGKDREGTFHPKKGKPSGEGHKKGNDIYAPDPDTVDKQTQDNQYRIQDEYGTDDNQEEVPGVRTRHPNRNEDKSRERSKPDSRRGSITRQQEISNDNQPKRDNHVRQGDGTQSHFFVLVLSKKNAKFFHGDVSGMHHVDLAELPNGIGDVVHLEEKDDQNLFRTGSSGGGTGSNYHGMGAGVPSDKENIAMYLKEVDRTLWKSVLNRENAPMVLAGVEYVVAIYKEVSQYKHITDEFLAGSFENADPKVIYEKAKEIVNPITVL
jgi:hypothetical protein